MRPELEKKVQAQLSKSIPTTAPLSRTTTSVTERSKAGGAQSGVKSAPTVPVPAAAASVPVPVAAAPASVPAAAPPSSAGDRFSALREKARKFHIRAQATKASTPAQEEAAAREATDDVLASMTALNRRMSTRRGVPHVASPAGADARTLASQVQPQETSRMRQAESVLAVRDGKHRSRDRQEGWKGSLLSTARREA